MISAIEFRAEDDPELATHTHAKRIEMRTVSPSREVRLAVPRARLPKEQSRAGTLQCGAGHGPRMPTAMPPS